MLVAILLHQKIDIKSSRMSSLGTGLTKLLPSSFLRVSIHVKTCVCPQVLSRAQCQDCWNSSISNWDLASFQLSWTECVDTYCLVFNELINTLCAKLIILQVHRVIESEPIYFYTTVLEVVASSKDAHRRFQTLLKYSLTDIRLQLTRQSQKRHLWLGGCQLNRLNLAW